MPLFTAAVAAASAAIASFFTAAGIASAVLQAAVGIGLNLIVAAIKGKPQQEPVGIQGKLGTGGDVPRSFLLGDYNTAGSLVYHGAYHKAGDTPNALYAQVVALSDLPQPSILEYWLDGQQLTVTTGGGSVYGNPSAQHVSNGDDHLWFRYYDGTQTVADAELVSAFGTSDRPYGADRIGRGISYVIVTALMDMRDQDNPMFKGFPQCRFTLKGIPLYDPSRDSTVGGVGSHRWDDQSTWGGDGDRLPAVQIYNILRGIRWNGQWLYGLQSSSPAILPAANWIAGINKCRLQVDGPDGPEPQYRSAVQVNVDTDPFDMITALEKTCSGHVSEVGGVYTIQVGEPESPSIAFSDDDILSSEPQNAKPFRTLADTVNGVVASYPEPLEGWNVKPSPPRLNPTQEVRVGNRRLMADVDLAACPYRGQVQRLLKSAMNEALRERRHTIVLPQWAQCLEPADVVEWTSPRNGYESKWFRIDGMAYQANLDVMLQLTEVDPSDYDWHQGSDYVAPVFAPMQILRPAPQPIVAWYAEGQIVNDANGLPRRPVIYLSWDGSKSDIRGVSYEIATAASDANIILRDQTDDARRGSIIVSSQAFIPGQTYYARGRYMPSAPRDTPFSAWLPAILPNVNYGLVDFDQGVQKQVTSVLDDKFEELSKKIAKTNTIASQALARTFLDKKEVRSQQSSLYQSNKAFIELVQTTAADSDAAIAQTIEVLRATVQNGNASLESEITDTRTTLSNTNTTLGQLQTDVQAQIGTGGVGGTLRSSVSANALAIATLNGYAAAQWSVLTDVNGNVAGLVLFNGGGSTSTFQVLVNNFYVAFPGAAGGTPVPVFTIGNVNGVAKIAMRGDMWIDGNVIARMIGAGQIQAVAIGAQQINTAALAINSVGIDQVIANAITNTKVFPWSATSPATIAATTTLVSQAVNIQSGKALVSFDGGWAGYGGGVGVNTTIGLNSAGAQPTLVMDILVDGSIVKTIVTVMTKTGTYDYAIGVPVGGQYTATGLSAGNHTFAVQYRYGGSTDFYLTNCHIYIAAGEMRVQDFRNG